MPRKENVKIGQTKYQRIFDWSGGMNDAVSPSLLNDNESPMFKNASLDEKGTLFPRKGSAERYSPDIGSQPVTGLGAYYKSDGTSRLLIGAGTGLYTDKPHITETFDFQSDWQGGTLAGFASATKVVGSVTNDGTPPTEITQTTDTQAQWNLGTKTNVVSKADGSIECAVANQALNIIKTSKADWDTHILTNMSTALITNSVVLSPA